MKDRLADAGRGLCAGVALVVLLIGVPVMVGLIAGWPLPHGLPPPAEIRQALENGWSPDASFVLKALAIVCWLAWAQVAGCAAVEIVSIARRRQAPAVPLAGWVQPLVARLVGALFLLSTVLGPTATLAAAPLSPVVATAAPPPGQMSPAPTRTLDAPELKRHVVVRRDTLWGLAERHLGDPFRYRELFELNRGRLQPDGRSLQQAHWIYPGWVLLFPAEATGLNAEQPHQPVAAAADPSVVDGGVLSTPQATTPNRTSSSTSVATTAPNGREPRTTHRAKPRAARANGHHHAAPIQQWALGLGAAGLAAGGVVGALDRRRRRRQRQRQPGERQPVARPTLEPVERKLRAIAREDAAAWLDAGLRFLTVALANRGHPPTQILAVRVGTLGLEFLLAERDDDPPEGFEVVDEGNVWRLAPDLDLEVLRERAADATPALPALVTVGETTDGPLLVNLEAAACLSVEGDAGRGDAVIAGIVLELATSSWSRGVRVLADGVDDALTALDETSQVTVADELPALERAAQSAAQDLDDQPTTLAARCADAAADAWLPTIVVAGPSVTGPATEQLAEIATASRGNLAAVAAGVESAPWRLLLSPDGTGLISPLGLQLRNRTDATTVSQMATLLTTTERVEEGEPVATASPVVVEEDEEDAPADEPATAEVVVSVLGPVEVEGWDAVPARRRLVEVVVYLATHSRPVPIDVIRAAVWPPDEHGDELTNGSFKTAISRARAALGVDSAGRKHLPEAREGRYQLGDAVRCDWIEFRRLERASTAALNGDAEKFLRQALELVRGPPFAGVPSNTYGWAWSEQLVSDMEAAITDAASGLGELALAAGDTDLADWAARQGLRAVPGQEALYRLRLRAAAARGDVGALDQVRREAERAVHAFDPTDELSDETLDLFEQLRADRRFARNGDGSVARAAVPRATTAS